MSDEDLKQLARRKEQLAEKLRRLGASKGSQRGQRNGRPRAVSCLAYLLIDCSGSMDGAKLAQAKAGAAGFAEDAIAKGYAIGLVSFSSTAQLVAEPLADLLKLKPLLAALEVQGSTNMSEGLELAAAGFRGPFQHAAAVVISDGMPDDVDAALRAGARLKERGVDIIAIGTDDANRTFLEALASRSDLAFPVPQRQMAASIRSTAKLLRGGSG